MSLYRIRPISDRTAFTGRHGSSPFGAAWSSTRELLARELRALAARDTVLEIDVAETMIRLDGELYANARPSSPAVRLAFESKVGPLTYATDRFWSWQDNLRAIALGLEALRKVDRYGITERGEQYAGFKALPAGRAMPASHMTRDDAIAVLADLHGYPTEYYAAEPAELRTAWRFARTHAHPDRHDGDRRTWDLVEQAAAALGFLS